MSDDWRVEIDVEEHGGLQHLRDRARERAVGREAREQLGEDVNISVDDDRLYAYADTEARVREAERLLRELAAEHGLQATSTVARWHPEEERWEPADVPLPSTPAEHAAEREARDAEQAAEAAEHGYATWEVRVEMADDQAASELATRLESSGLSVVRRSHVVVVGLATEREANALAERLRSEVPEAKSVTAEGSAADAMAEQRPASILTGRWRRP